MSARRKWTWVAIGTAAVLAVISVADARGFRRYLALKADVQSLTERNHALEEQNAAMLREVEALRGDQKALERAAREELGFVKPGEIVLNLE
ncbi:MAG: FtsB family cell division protein [Myxococcaceae bacterium]